MQRPVWQAILLNRVRTLPEEIFWGLVEQVNAAGNSWRRELIAIFVAGYLLISLLCAFVFYAACIVNARQQRASEEPAAAVKRAPVQATPHPAGDQVPRLA